MTESGSIYDDYFKYTEQAYQKYGANSIVLMQVGAFYEMYGIKMGTNGVTNGITNSKVQDIANICGGLAISEKKATYGATGAQIVMAGFRDYTLEKHAQRIVESGYTALIYDQQKQGTKFVRVLTQVLSAGTYLPTDTTTAGFGGGHHITNHILCVWMEVFGTKLVCGVAAVNIISGKSTMFEFQTQHEISSPTTFDELERCVSTYLPSELIFASPFEKDVATQIASYAGIQCPIVHYVRSDNADRDSIEHRCGQQVYLRHVLETYFQPNTYDVCSEFQEYSVATQAYCYLLNFIHEHNANLIRKIALPDFHNGSREMLLANHTLKQLNLVDDVGIEMVAGTSTKYRSVAAFLNRCCSAIGKRRFFAQITRPVFDVEWLNKEYDAIEWMLNLQQEMRAMLRKQLAEVTDLEKIERQIVIRRAGPESIYRLFTSLLAINQASVCFAETDLTCLDIQYEDICEAIQSILRQIDDTFVFTADTSIEKSAISDALFKTGVDATLDHLVETQERDEHLFVSIRTTFNRIMSVCEKSAAAIDYVKVHDTEKSGSTLQITKKRAATLKTHLAEMAKKNQSIEFYTSSKEKIGVLASEIRFVSAGASNDEIEFPLLNRILRERFEIKDRILNESVRVFNEWIARFEQCIPKLRQVVEFVARVDVLQSKCYVAHKFNYCRPQIVVGQNDLPCSFVEATGLRHCLIEHIQTKEIYIPNNISIGNSDCGEHRGGTTETNTNGILLYGTNAVGKTSLIRALGIAVVMAQAGMYVPAASFRYGPYRAIYSRILGNDNLFKNLSTFAVEMSELRTILKNADRSSLILGDELCSGTESESALSIFMAGLMDLYDKRASFVFATHFHEILKFSEMSEIEDRVQIKHMAVHYDREQDKLVYDRVLRDGPGNRVYGLEVAKALHLPPEFIERAYQIRQKYYPDTQGPLSNNATRYNAKKIRGMCEECKIHLAEETHHILQQKDADERGFFAEENTKGVHKNHPANLMALCSKCHDKIHMPPSKTVRIVKKTIVGKKNIG